jgi:hypothetical protein
MMRIARTAASAFAPLADVMLVAVSATDGNFPDESWEHFISLLRTVINRSGCNLHVVCGFFYASTHGTTLACCAARERLLAIAIAVTARVYYP